MDPEQFKTIDDILAFAAEKEQEASDLYSDLAGKSDREAARQMFLEFSRQEAGHKTRILGIQRNKLPSAPVAEVEDLKISDYLSDVAITPTSSYQDILIFAMKREESSVSLYGDMAKIAGDEPTKTLFLTLVEEEKKHKLRLESEYDEYVLRDN